MDPFPSLVLAGLSTTLGSVSRTAAELSATYSEEQDDPDDPTAMTGITSLFRFAHHETLMDVSAACALRAIRNAGLTLDDIGGIVAPSNFTHATLVPTFGPALGAQLGLRNVRAATIGTGCGGLAQAVEHAVAMMTSHLVRWPRGKACLVVAGDRYSRHLDPADRKTCYLFSEGVAAFVIVAKRRRRPGDLIIKHAESRGLIMKGSIDALVLGNANTTKGSDPYFRMQTAPVARFTRDVLGAAKAMLELRSWNGVSIIPHQANARLLAPMRAQASGAASFHTNGIATIGNVLNASTLFELQHALSHNTLGSKDIVLIPFGAEWMMGVIRLEVAH